MLACASSKFGFLAALATSISLRNPLPSLPLRILGEFSDFSTFNDLLTQTKLADEINRRQTITVLAVDNGAAGGISSLPSDVQRKVLSVHVVLDYYDTDKLGAMKNHSAVLTTLFQSSGQATDRMGFLNYTKRPDGVMVFYSAEPGAPVNSQMVKVVASRPYNISVLQISSAIVPPDAPAPGPSDDDASADAPADAPAPTADGPTADGPAEADAPAHDKSNAADAPEGSAAGRAVAGAGLGIVALVVIIFTL
ncbi:hypothetical protein E2562_001174 [Oryza meyeriana var. granulata]|uniref:FAS1 domain-containing protein n=1 Tax=Oryza meyeriana var. granulata TaxID=110450 RepID=A0A6G1DBU7_9ORYZ|nr:hypothetical protein E2562_001174 [Oryza meyeriana var. granulata]